MGKKVVMLDNAVFKLGIMTTDTKKNQLFTWVVLFWGLVFLVVQSI